MFRLQINIPAGFGLRWGCFGDLWKYYNISLVGHGTLKEMTDEGDGDLVSKILEIFQEAFLDQIICGIEKIIALYSITV